jgi:hypothetical protein
MKTLDELKAALESQDAALSNAKRQLADMGDVQFHIPQELLQQLDDACTVHTSNTIQLCAVRA